MKTVRGNLIKLAKTGQFDIIAHGCNCFNTMGAGIAAQIKKEFPMAYRADSQYYSETFDRLKLDASNHNWSRAMLGNFSVAKYKAFTVLNIYTQFHPGANFELSALTEALKKINYIYKGKSIAFPKIGAGIGGGHWPDIYIVIKKLLPNLNVTIVEYAN